MLSKNVRIMTYEEKLDLYNRAKQAYYNGVPIMTDMEFDKLERELGLENKGYIGAKNNPSYTVKHPFIMGSLSKVQVHRDDNNVVDYETPFKDVLTYIHRNGKTPVIITPKYDGCSFEFYYDNGVYTCSTRGDGEYGKDVSHIVAAKISQRFIKYITDYCGYKRFTLRGELLVNRFTFYRKYNNEFKQPRSFVSGMIGRDNLDNDIINDIDIVIYDYRVYDDGHWEERSWFELTDEAKFFPTFYFVTELNDVSDFSKMYAKFEAYRKEGEWALDGFVIKPIISNRIQNFESERPKDCVAVKFLPMVRKTTVTDITWSLGKSNEYTPIVQFDSVEIDGRDITRCSGYNYGWLRDNMICKGTQVEVTVSGDIIPKILKVISTPDTVIIPIPDNSYVDGGIHLIASLTEKEHARNRFVSSCETLEIPNIGPATANAIFDYMTREDELTTVFFDEPKLNLPTNILQLTEQDVYFGAGEGKAGDNAKRSFKKIIENLTLADVICSLNFKQCGRKIAEQIENMLLGTTYDFTSMSSQAYMWCFNDTSDEMLQLNDVLKSIGRTIEDFKKINDEKNEETKNQIPVILTGEPNDYRSKGDFLSHHPEYRVTGSWKEVQIVFTNSLESNTGKMKKAREKGIEIRLY